jgi:hypothetical protein
MTGPAPDARIWLWWHANGSTGVVPTGNPLRSRVGCCCAGWSELAGPQRRCGAQHGLAAQSGDCPAGPCAPLRMPNDLRIRRACSHSRHARPHAHPISDRTWTRPRDGLPHACQGCWRRSRWADAALARGAGADRDGRMPPLPGGFGPIAMGGCTPCPGCPRRSRWADPTLAQGGQADRDGRMPPLPGVSAPIAMGGSHPCPGCSRRSRWADASLSQGVRGDRDGRMRAFPRVFAPIAIGECDPCPGCPRR